MMGLQLGCHNCYFAASYALSAHAHAVLVPSLCSACANALALTSILPPLITGCSAQPPLELHLAAT